MNEQDQLIEEYLRKIKMGDPVAMGAGSTADMVAADEQAADTRIGANFIKDILQGANQIGTLGGKSAQVQSATLDDAAKRGKEVEDYLNKQYAGRQDFAQKMALQKPKEKVYDTLETSEGIVLVNKNDPTDIVKTGLRKPVKEEKPEMPQQVSGYVIKGSDQPVFRTRSGYVDAKGRPVKDDDVIVKSDKPTNMTYEQKIAGLGATEKGRFDNIRMASNALHKMTAYLNKGGDRYSLIGDNPFTSNLGLFEEALGRMQSGGAITGEEVARFKSMARSALDNPETQNEKLQTLIGEMNSRMQTLGIRPDEITDEEYIKSKQDYMASLKPKSESGTAIASTQEPSKTVKVKKGTGKPKVIPIDKLSEAQAYGYTEVK